MTQTLRNLAMYFTESQNNPEKHVANFGEDINCIILNLLIAY